MGQDISNGLKERIDAFRPVPFWSWNDRLEPNRLRRQVRAMAEAGLGGFFMHARVGLATPYLGEEWMDCVAACLDEAEKTGLAAWGYDENGYPSGIAGGAVTQIETYRSTWLEPLPAEQAAESGYPVLAAFRRRGNDYIRCDLEEAEFAAVVKNEIRASDPLNAEAVSLFLKLTHERYHARFRNSAGKTFPGFFTDEPQLKMYRLPWSAGLDATFRNTYGYELPDRLPALWYDTEDCAAVRHDFWRLVNRLYCENYGKQIYDWCEARGLKTTGHVMGEDSLSEQMASTGGVMPFYEYLHIPGMDWLKRRIGSPVVPKQVASAAAQLGREQVLSETFALCGWDVSFEELYRIAAWQFVCGINLLCPHLESYSLKGIRKRDHPPSLFVHQSWWPEYRLLNDRFAAVGAALAQGEEICDVLVLHPLFGVYTEYDCKPGNPKIEDLDRRFTAVSTRLSDLGIPYHYGDETLIEKYGDVRDGRLIVGRRSYSKVVLAGQNNMAARTFELLERYCRQGGRLYAAGERPVRIDGRPDPRPAALPAEPLTEENMRFALGDEEFAVTLSENGEECRGIWLQKRRRDYGALIYAVNTDDERPRTVRVFVRGAKALSLCDPAADRYEALPAEVTPEGASATVRIRRGGDLFLATRPGEPACAEVSKTVRISLPAEAQIPNPPLNTLTLDRCDLRVDGGEVMPNLPLYKIQRMLLDRQKACDAELTFRFETAFRPEKLWLVAEEAREFEIRVNGRPVPYRDEGCFLDPCFEKTDIREFVRIGVNEITLKRRFWQREELLRFLYRPKDLSSNHYAVDFDFESVTYDVELEPIYLLGDFDVQSRSPYLCGERRSLTTAGPFVLTHRRRTVRTGDLTPQGYPFFAGTLTLEWDVSLNPQSGCRYVLDMNKPDCPAANLYVNGRFAKTLIFDEETDVTAFLVPGVNRFALELRASLRNLLGPHHFVGGESYSVGPSTFTDTPSWNEDITGNIWRDDWCFVRFGPNLTQRENGDER